MGAPEDSELRRRLKCICSLANPADIKVDKVTHRLVAKHDAERKKMREEMNKIRMESIIRPFNKL